MSEASHARAVWQRLRADIYPRGGNDASRWSSAEPYLLRHAAKHAADAGELDQLITDAEFMVYADAPLLAAQLPTIDPAEGSPASGPCSGRPTRPTAASIRPGGGRSC